MVTITFRYVQKVVRYLYTTQQLLKAAVCMAIFRQVLDISNRVTFNDPFYPFSCVYKVGECTKATDVSKIVLLRCRFVLLVLKQLYSKQQVCKVTACVDMQLHTNLDVHECDDLLTHGIEFRLTSRLLLNFIYKVNCY